MGRGLGSSEVPRLALAFLEHCVSEDLDSHMVDILKSSSSPWEELV